MRRMSVAYLKCIDPGCGRRSPLENDSDFTCWEFECKGPMGILLAPDNYVVILTDYVMSTSEWRKHTKGDSKTMFDRSLPGWQMYGWCGQCQIPFGHNSGDGHCGHRGDDVVVKGMPSDYVLIYGED